MTALAQHLRRRIAIDGPIPVARFMAEALGHPEHGYYTTRDPLGAAGDFVTAPEVSQMFGELIGVWAAGAWRRLGAPETLRLVELGPGRGTLMADLLRAARVAPGFREAIHVHLVETSPTLRERQRRTLAGLQRGALPADRLHWHQGLHEVPDGPMILVANEFFDALPVRQLVRDEAGWRERLVAWDDEAGGFRFVLSPRVDPGTALIPPALRDSPPGALVEVSPASLSILASIAERLVRHGGSALVIDYGHLAHGTGDTLQAVRGHRPADPLADVGEADLTAHVDFQALAQLARRLGARIGAFTTQGQFLTALGIRARAATLSRAAGRAGEIESALARLVGPDQMGSLFKVMVVESPSPRPKEPTGTSA